MEEENIEEFIKQLGEGYIGMYRFNGKWVTSHRYITKGKTTGKTKEEALRNLIAARNATTIK